MSTPNEPLHVTPVSSLKTSPQSKKYYFTYPKRNNDKNGYHLTDIDKPSSKAPNPFIVNDKPMESASKCYYKLSNWFKILVILLLIGILITGAICNDETMEYSEDFLTWMKTHLIKGSFAFIGLYILCSVLMIPGSLLTLGAGFVYVQMLGQITGVLCASMVVFLGATLGATAAFINSRYLLRNIVTYYANKYPKFALIDSVVGMNGFKVVFLLRLSPITPYNVFNYFMGLTAVRLSAYFLASIGMIPDSIVYCFIGGGVASIAKLSSTGFASDPVLLIVTIVGTILSVIGIIYISYVAKKEFNKMASQSQIDNTDILANNLNDIDHDVNDNLNDDNVVEYEIENEIDQTVDIDYSCTDLLLTPRGSKQKQKQILINAANKSIGV